MYLEPLKKKTSKIENMIWVQINHAHYLHSRWENWSSRFMENSNRNRVKTKLAFLLFVRYSWSHTSEMNVGVCFHRWISTILRLKKYVRYQSPMLLNCNVAMIIVYLSDAMLFVLCVRKLVGLDKLAFLACFSFLYLSEAT